MLLEKEMNIKNSFLGYIRYKRLNWYGQVQRMHEDRLLEKISDGFHLEDEEREDLEIRRCRKLQQEWERWELNNLEWVDREGWRTVLRSDALYSDYDFPLV